MYIYVVLTNLCLFEVTGILIVFETLTHSKMFVSVFENSFVYIAVLLFEAKNALLLCAFKECL
jgi:hypothetical protein